MISETSFVLS